MGATRRERAGDPSHNADLPSEDSGTRNVQRGNTGTCLLPRAGSFAPFHLPHPPWQPLHSVFLLAGRTVWMGSRRAETRRPDSGAGTPLRRQPCGQVERARCAKCGQGRALCIDGPVLVSLRGFFQHVKGRPRQWPSMVGCPRTENGVRKEARANDRERESLKPPFFLGSGSYSLLGGAISSLGLGVACMTWSLCSTAKTERPPLRRGLCKGRHVGASCTAVQECAPRQRQAPRCSLDCPRSSARQQATSTVVKGSAHSHPHASGRSVTFSSDMSAVIQ